VHLQRITYVTDTADFLSSYQNVLLRHIIMPGSHDAGLADEFYGSKGLGAPKGQTVTQNLSVGAQARAGSRFFDVRIIMSGNELKSYHSPGDTRLVGGTGQGFEEILDQLLRFVAGHPTEFVIIRLSHMKDSEQVFAALNAWMLKVSTGRPNGYYVYKGTGNLAQKQVREFAGKMILLIDQKKMAKNLLDKAGKKAHKADANTMNEQAKGYHALIQNKDNKALPSVTNGMCICGEFSKSTKLTDIIAGQTKNYTIHARHRTTADDRVHLYCLYWTSTGGNIKENTDRVLSQNFQLVRDMVASSTGGTVAKCIDKGIPLTNTKAWSEAVGNENIARDRYAVYGCALPNIIMYDFVNSATSRQIIGLNGLVPTRG
jgi:hypothetical protein